ncbi:hypothetical protein A3A67_03940 [Candidatus Peribacteria bacterium RIFCSPLOWO2_01_FULL_51_18]|nr:MAG: hypothetical protein A3A67_03940 [Candidatus Peribacteria bacterium RIFCSPLOWO2_01_FULL_51_18]
MENDSLSSHVGRSHHAGLEITLSALGGFAASFLIFLVAARQSNTFRGQLIAGDPAVNRQFPSTLNTMQTALSGGNPIASSMTSYGFWVAVIIFGSALSFLILKLLRRYV